MNRCPAITAKGTHCKGLVKLSNEYCSAHDPSRAEDRRRVASIAGRGNKQGGEIAEVKARLRELAEDVIQGRVDRGKASVAFQGLGVLKGFLELERKVRELDEIEERLAELERLAQDSRSQSTRTGRTWRA